MLLAQEDRPDLDKIFHFIVRLREVSRMVSSRNTSMAPQRLGGQTHHPGPATEGVDSPFLKDTCTCHTQGLLARVISCVDYDTQTTLLPWPC